MMLLGVISDHRAARSKSPAMHNRVLAELGIAGIYLPLEVAEKRLGQAVNGLRGLGFRGANVTVPFKEQVMDHLDRLAPEARAIGAVNTIAVQDGLLVGHNTDAPGFAAALAQACPIPPQGRAVVLGTGGAAKAVVQALSQSEVGEILVCGRNKPVPDRFGSKVVWRNLERLVGEPLEAEVVINATSVSAPAEAPDLAALMHGVRLSGCHLVMDLNYGRDKNIWAGLAGRSGARFRDGLAMLAHQAAASFRLWTGKEIPAERFRAGLEEGK